MTAKPKTNPETNPDLKNNIPKEIEDLIDKKILKAKIVVLEKRLSYVLTLAGALLILFGILFPIWQAGVSTDKVDSAIFGMKSELKDISNSNKEFINYSNAQLEKLSIDSKKEIDNKILSMENNFKELAGTQLRKPDLICNYNGIKINNSDVIQTNLKTKYFQIINIGDFPAKTVTGKLYMKIDSKNFNGFSIINDNYDLFYSADNYGEESDFNIVCSFSTSVMSIINCRI